MNKYIVGKIYNIVMLKEIFKNDNGRIMANVECILCGNNKNMRASDLIHERTTSCRCKVVKHNLSNSKLYSVYHNIKDRCYNPNCHAYKDYGKRNIKLCTEWLDSSEGFHNFYNWSMQSGYKEGLTIDRIDVNNDYKPDNCRWITLSENVTLANKLNARRRADKGDYYGISPTKEYFEFENANAFGRENDLNGSNIRDVAQKRKKTHKGWIFGYISEINNK